MGHMHLILLIELLLYISDKLANKNIVNFLKQTFARTLTPEHAKFID